MQIILISFLTKIPQVKNKSFENPSQNQAFLSYLTLTHKPGTKKSKAKKSILSPHHWCFGTHKSGTKKPKAKKSFLSPHHCCFGEKKERHTRRKDMPRLQETWMTYLVPPDGLWRVTLYQSCTIAQPNNQTGDF